MICQRLYNNICRIHPADTNFTESVRKRKVEYQVLGSDVEDWETLILLYNSALKEIGTKVDILNDEFQHIHQYNPIEHTKMRVKTS